MSGQVQEEYPLVGSYGNNRSNWFYAGVIIFIGWNILIFALAVAAITKVNNLDDDSPTYNMGQTMTLPIVGTVPEFTAVSLLENGTLRAGAGISIYRKEPSSPPFGDGSQNLRMVRFVDDRSSNEVIAVWTNNTGTYAVVATLALDKRAIYAWYQPQRMVFNNFWDLITLPNGHFVVAADTGVYAGTVDTRPGWMNITSMSNRTYPKESWKNIRIISMGLSHFVLTYDVGLISINSTRTTFGAIVGSVIFDMSNKVPNISFVTPDVPVPKSSGFPVHEAFVLTNSTFAFVYGDDQGGSANPQLACTVGRFTPPNILAFQTTSIFPGIVPEFYLSAVSVNDENGVVFLVNAANNYDLIAVFIHRNPNGVDGMHFGDVVTIESGVADSFYINSFKNRKVPFIDAARIHSNKLIVAWADFTNNGILTTALVTIDQALNLHTSPLYVIGNPLPISDLTNYSVSVASLIGDTEFGAAIIERKQGDYTNLALMEVAPKALGVSNHRAFHGQNLQVTVGGLVDVPPSSQFDLKPGYLYYTKSDGSLVAALLAGTQDRSHSYVTLDDGTIVSIDSVVGIAVGHRQLYVLPSYGY